MDNVDIENPIVRALLMEIDRERAVMAAEAPVLAALKIAHDDARDKHNARRATVARHWNALASIANLRSAAIADDRAIPDYVEGWISELVRRTKGLPAPAVPAETAGANEVPW